MPSTAGSHSVTVNPKRMKEGKDTQQRIVSIEHEHLAKLLDVGHDVVMRQHDAFGLAGAAAGKNHGGQIVEPRSACRPLSTRSSHQPRQEPQQQRDDFFAACLVSRQPLRAKSFSPALAAASFRATSSCVITVCRSCIARRTRRASRSTTCNSDSREFCPRASPRNSQRARHGRRQQNADHFLSLPGFPQSARQENRRRAAPRPIVTRGRRSSAIAKRKRMPARGADQRSMASVCKRSLR